MRNLVALLFLLFPWTTQSMFIGTATSAYQIEGWNKGRCIWDDYTQQKNITPVGNATNHYLLFRDDIQMMKNLGFQHYRFSISWTRIMPFYFGQTDPDGLRFYHDVINECLRNNITPYVTLYHWDLPAYLHREGGWLDSQLPYYFLEYAQIMFLEYGKKVKFWMTVNEPLTTSNQGYGPNCNFAPGVNCSDQNRFLSARNQLLAHALVGNYYKHHYTGDIGLVINTNWIQPIDVSSEGFARRQMDETLGWFLEPILWGKFPDILHSKTQPFNDTERQLLMDSYTFLAFNHYTTYYVNGQGQNSVDPEWEPGQSTWLYDAPRGLSSLLYYLRDHYHVPETLPIFITECGFSQQKDGLLDMERVHYISGYLREANKCIRDGVNLLGFFVWSLLDNFEWSSGYSETFGIVYVNRTDGNFTRTPKWSARVLSTLLEI